MIASLAERYRRIPIQLKASFWFLVCSVMQKGISVITTPIFTRLMSTDAYGKYNVFNSWYGVLSVFITLRLYYGVYSQGLIKFEEIRDQYSSALQGLTLTLCIVWFGVYLAFRSFWNKLFSLSTSAMLAMFVIIWATAVFSFWAANQRVDYQYRRLLILTLIVTLLKPALGIVMVMHAEDKALARVWGLAIVELLCYIGLFVEQMKKGRTFFSKKIWTYALGFNIPLIPHYLSQTVLSSSDRIIIQRLVSDSAAGIYGLAYSIAMLMLLFNEAMQQTLAPWIYRHIKEGRIGNIHRVVYVTLVLVAGANLMLIVIAPEAVRLFAPIDYYEATWVIPPIAMSTFFIYLYNVFSYFEFYYEKTSYIAISTMIAAVANILLNFTLIPRFGYSAAGYSTLVCYIIYAILHYCVMDAICQTECGGAKIYNPLVLASVGISFMILGFGAMTLYGHALLRYGIVLLAMTVAFVQRNRLVGFVKSIRSA